MQLSESRSGDGKTGNVGLDGTTSVTGWSGKDSRNALHEFFKPGTLLLGPWVSMAAYRFSGEALFLTSNNQAVVNGVQLGSVRLYNDERVVRWHIARSKF